MIDLGTWPDHLLTIAEWDALPEDNSRHYELVEGVFAVTPRAPALHQRLVRRLTTAFDDALTPRWEALHHVALTVAEAFPPTIRVPDVVVLPPEVIDDRTRTDPADVLAVAEVLWDGTRDTDRISKPVDYAEAGIGCYLLVDPGPPTTLTEFRLRGDVYERVAEHSGTANLTLDGSAVVVDLAGMLEP